jgi:RNA polymerase sigma factor (sigma-70 family)
MNSLDTLAGRFNASRPRLTALAYRILENRADADDAVQDAWVRLSRPGATETTKITNLDGWMTTAVSRACLNKLRTRAARREDTIDATALDLVVRRDDSVDPEDQALLAEQISLALYVVLETLTPPERLAFVLHDSFGLPFDEIAAVLEKSVDATRKLASRARNRVHGVDPTDIETDPAKQRRVVDAFFKASRTGDFDTLLDLLHPGVIFHADGGTTRPEATATIRGRDQVVKRVTSFAIPDAKFQPITVNRSAGVLVRTHQQPISIMAFIVSQGRIAQIYSLLDAPRLRRYINQLQ